jgi:hypothetical protein
MIATIGKTGLRRKMLDACVTKQQALIDDFKKRIKALMESDGLGNEESYDNTDLATNSQKIPEINALNEALEFANKELELLESLKNTLDLIRNKAMLGAVVVTNHNIFSITVSIEKFEVDGDTYVGVSVQSPIFHAMSGKRKGESFTFKRKTYKIKDIF